MADQLRYEKRGQTVTVFYRDRSQWPIYLAARHVYYGTGRLLATLTLTRFEPGMKEPLVILTSHVDLLIASRRKEFAKLSTERLGPTMEASRESVQTAIEAMQDGMTEHLLGQQASIEMVAYEDIELPEDLTPPYVVWPFVPSSRPGMLIAPAGTGKSSLALMTAISTVTGHEFHPRIVPRKQGPVLYVAQEEDRQQWATRVKMICAGHELDPPKKHMHYLHLSGASLLDSADLISESAASSKAVLIIIDSAQATWGEEEGASIRGYATRWFNTAAELGVPVWIIDHPNLTNTMKGNAMVAAGAGVKRDRVGHQWGMKSILLPARPGQPYRYHVTLTDVKRNYVAMQDQILYEAIVKGHEWMKFEEAEPPGDATIKASNKMDMSIYALMQNEPGHENGWSVNEIRLALGQKDDARIRAHLEATFPRHHPDDDKLQFRFEKVAGTGGERVAARYLLVVRPKPDTGDQSPFEFGSPPGDPDELS